MIHYSQRADDCKSPIRRFDSDPRLHSKNGERNSAPRKNSKNVVRKLKYLTSIGVEIPVEIHLTGKSKKIALSFEYKGTHRINLNCGLDELTEQEVYDLVQCEINAIDNIKTLEMLFDFVLTNDECGGALSTRKKVVANAIDYFKRDGIPLNSSTRVLLRKDEYGRTLPERWQDIYKLPHKLRQVRSLFSRKNLVLFNRGGWDTSHFGNFVSFVAETTVSQPFTTSDIEVNHIIDFFNKARDEHPIFYDIYMLAFGCGLRQSEIYQVRYEHFTTFNGQCFLNMPYATKRTKLKNLKSGEKVGISQQVYDHFVCREKTGEVIIGGKRLHKRFVKFLKNEVGITENKACHRLRKILGARLASTAGIYHAAKTLRNSVQVAERYYSDLVEHRNDLVV